MEAKTREEAEKKALAYEFESEHMEAVHFEEVLLDTLEEEEE